MAFHEDRARRPSQERQDLAVQPADRRDRRDLVVRHRARRDARGRGPGARRARRAADRDVQAEEDDLRHLRGGGPRRHREGRAAGARGQGVPQRRRAAARGARFPRQRGRRRRPGRRHRRSGDRADPGRSRGGGAAARAARGADQEEADRHGRVRADGTPEGEALARVRAADPGDGAQRRRGAGPPRLHLPVAEADPALPQPVREGDRARDDARGELRPAERWRRGRPRGSAGSPR